MSGSATNALQIVPPAGLEKPVQIDPALLAERDRLLVEIAAAEVSTPADFDAAGKLLRDVTRVVKDSDAARLALQRPFADVVTRIRDTINGEVVKPLDAAKKQLQDAMATYVRAEQARQEAAQRAAAEAAAAQATHREGAAAEPVFDEPAAPINLPHARGIVTTERLACEVTAPDDLPRRFMSPDLAKIRAYQAEHADELKAACKAAGGSMTRDGVKWSLVTQVQSRG